MIRESLARSYLLITNDEQHHQILLYNANNKMMDSVVV